MHGFHLSRFLPGQPPAPHIQDLNALLHQEPYATIAYCVSWAMLLSIGAPLAVIALALMLPFQLIKHYFFDQPQRILPIQMEDKELAVLVTGCDSGFGKELAFRLASEGFFVFAGILKPSSKELFRGDSLIEPLVLDVTNEKNIQAAYDRVSRWLRGGNNNPRYFHSLVNNAGLGRFGLIDWTTMDDYEICMNVNCYGPIRMVKTFLPLLKQQAIQGEYKTSQIVNLVSVAGMMSASGLGGTPYEVSKNAAEAFTDCLRLELKTFGINVVAVNPSFHSTDMVDSTDEVMDPQNTWNRLSEQHQQEYGREFVDKFCTHSRTMIRSNTWDFKVVIESLMEIVLSSNPPAQVVVGMDFRYGAAGARMLPQWLRNRLTLLFMPYLEPASMRKSSSAKPTKAE